MQPEAPRTTATAVGRDRAAVAILTCRTISRTSRLDTHGDVPVAVEIESGGSSLLVVNEW